MELTIELRGVTQGGARFLDATCELENASRVLAWLQADIRAATVIPDPTLPR